MTPKLRGMTTPGHIVNWHGWSDEARRLDSDHLVNGRPGLPWELDILTRARRAAAEAEANALFSGVDITENIQR